MKINPKRRSRIRSIQLKYKFTSENFFAVLLGLIWVDHTLLTYVRAVLIRIPYIAEYREDIMTCIFLLALLFSLPYMLKRIPLGVVIAYLAITSVYLINMLLFPENQEALEANLVPFLFESLPLVFIGVAMNLRKHYQMLFSLSMISVIARFVHLLLEPYNNIDGDMYSSYLLLPHVCMVIVTTFSRRNLLNIAVSVVGILTIFSFGSRGPILCIFCLIAIFMLLFGKIHKNFWLFFLIVLSIFCTIFFYEEIAHLLLSLISSMGMSTRVVDMMLAGIITSTSSRDVIARWLMDAVSDNWFGYGIAADRTLVGMYAHNIVLELWVSYGVLAGTLLFAVPVLNTMILLHKKSRECVMEDAFLVVLISSCFIKLFLSGTYLTESFLYLLLGVLISEQRAMKIRARTANDNE